MDMKRLRILFAMDTSSGSTAADFAWAKSLITIMNRNPRIDIWMMAAHNNDLRIKLEAERVYWLSTDQHAGTSDTEMIGKNIQELDNQYDFHVILMAGRSWMEQAVGQKYAHKTIACLPHEVKLGMRKFYRKVYAAFPLLFVPNDHVRKKLQGMLPPAGKPIISTEYVKDDVAPPVWENERFVISAFCPEGHTRAVGQLLELQTFFTKEEPAVSWVLAKHEGHTDELTEKLKQHAGLNWHNPDAYRADIACILPGTSKETARELLLSYGINGTPVVLQRTKEHMDLLGRDYPLFAGTTVKMKEKLQTVLQSKTIYETTAKACWQAAKNYRQSVVEPELMQALWRFNPVPKTVLFAGHDFKFISWYMERLQAQQKCALFIDLWRGHEAHDETVSHMLLKQADIIFCEWGLGNAVFYAQHKLPHQKLYVRVHRQELETAYLQEVDFQKVDAFIAVGPYVMEEFIRLKRMPRHKVKIIPNMVDTQQYILPKTEESKFHLGLLGMLPQLKRLDRALDVFEKLWERDERFKLYIKGRRPEELSWMKYRKKEMQFYKTQFERIEQAPWKDQVIFESFGPDVAEWMQQIGYMLSTSDVEGFHLAPMEGMASGAQPILFNWPGAELIYPAEHIVDTVDAAVEKIWTIHEKGPFIEAEAWMQIAKRYEPDQIAHALDQVLLSEAEE